MIYSNARPNCTDSDDTIRVELKATDFRGAEIVVADLILAPHVAEALSRRLRSSLSDWRARADQSAPLRLAKEEKA